MNPTSSSEPQGSEQPVKSAAQNTAEAVQAYLEDCSAAERWPSWDSVKRIFADNFAPIIGERSNPLPTPIADEEVETPLVDAAFAEYPVMDTQRGGDAITIQAARAIEKQLRQQHNAEREDWQAFDKIHRSQIEFHQSELRQLRASLAEVQSELATAQAQLAECYKLSGADPDGNEDWRLAPRALDAVKELRTDYDEACSQLRTAMEERDAINQAADRMFSVVAMRRNPDALQERADLLIDRGWTPIPFTPEGAPEGFTAKITHPYQKWQKLHHMNKITEQALKIELREDTDNLRALLSRLSTSRSTENKKHE